MSFLTEPLTAAKAYDRIAGYPPKRLQSDTAAELDALRPVVFDRAFKGVL